MAYGTEYLSSQVGSTQTTGLEHKIVLCTGTGTVVDVDVVKRSRYMYGPHPGTAATVYKVKGHYVLYQHSMHDTGT